MLHERILDELEEQCTQGIFIPVGRHDILADAIGRPENPGRIRGNGFGAHIQQPHVDLRTPDDHITRVSTKGSCADAVSGPSGGKTPPEDTGRFGFYMDKRPPCLVTIGRVHHGDSTLHYAPLPAHLVKVVVEKAVDGSAEVPITTEEDIERPEQPKKHARQDDQSSHRDNTMRELFGVAATIFSDSYKCHRIQLPRLCWC
ncbi:hypothetical protein OROMI_027831 [Orobanche minor]